MLKLAECRELEGKWGKFAEQTFISGDAPDIPEQVCKKYCK